ncbi:hypothetical protein UFOVP1565_29 [uncultured Caudovirales phage]|uniref:Uncharacterized protein n=1 Tax=uncultured Caudovirales phage TaxID=2100421 RepID=A0A6J5LTT6_9CAUD|nr:hypothetical protein UFOVP311_3 [uncultured Caudovirales phage]CAB4204007.1 hypothetical protein UFOVP1388_24 [uncultured Caudovirales phage]CAB5229963.1 hypothetical protein UFOVP1565_29 [uncultured Caudovirales phage]
MADPVAFEFETAKQLLRLLKKSKDGVFNSEVDDSIPLDHAPAFIWAYVPATVTCTYDATVKAWIIGGATTCYPINSGVDANGLMQWGKNNANGIVTGGITCTTFTPKLTSDQAAPSIGKGFYLGTIFGYNGSEQPRVLIGLPPVSSSSGGGGNAVIEVVSSVTCTPTGLEVSTVTLSGADYDNAVIRQFLALSDVTPSSYLANQGRVVKVNDAATALEFGPIVDAEYTTFIALSDTPAVYGSNAYKTLTVGSTSASIIFSANNVTTTKSLAGGGNPNDPSYVALSLLNDSTSPGNNRVYGTTSAGVKGWRTLQLTTLTDFPATTGNAGKFVTVNSGGTGVQYTAVDIQAMLDAITDLTARIVALEGA